MATKELDLLIVLFIGPRDSSTNTTHIFVSFSPIFLYGNLLTKAVKKDFICIPHWIARSKQRIAIHI